MELILPDFGGVANLRGVANSFLHFLYGGSLIPGGSCIRDCRVVSDLVQLLLDIVVFH